MANYGLRLIVTMLAFSLFLSLIDLTNSRAIPSPEDDTLHKEMEMNKAEHGSWEMEGKYHELNVGVDYLDPVHNHNGRGGIPNNN
ncbi:hypothetical protein CASFOL_020782 [Castilleja foliolosa]|uniref:Uncharacterized protein n=1 Tax=Castilleja foliolosa TaxID=1961234 RepID=A0ABD3D5L8_9LAMI